MNQKKFFIVAFFIIGLFQNCFGLWNRLKPDTKTRVVRMTVFGAGGALYFRYGPPYKTTILLNHIAIQQGIQSLNKNLNLYNKNYPSPETDALITGTAIGILIGEITALAHTVYEECFGPLPEEEPFEIIPPEIEKEESDDSEENDQD